MNNKYFTSNEIYVRLIGAYRNKGKDITPLNVMHWCSELMTEILRDPVGLVDNYKVPVKVKDGKALLPFNVFRLEAVFDNNGVLLKNDFMYQGQYIFFSSTNCPTGLKIDFKSIAVDDLGFPLIKRGYEQAAYAYCVYKMFEEDATAIPPRIQQWRWLQLCQDKDWEIEAASRSWMDLTDNDIREIHNIIVGPVFMSRINVNAVTELYTPKTAERS